VWGEDGNARQFRQSTFCLAGLKFNLMAPRDDRLTSASRV
jgi:hypothetical protein